VTVTSPIGYSTTRETNVSLERVIRRYLENGLKPTKTTYERNIINYSHSEEDIGNDKGSHPRFSVHLSSWIIK